MLSLLSKQSGAALEWGRYRETSRREQARDPGGVRVMDPRSGLALSPNEQWTTHVEFNSADTFLCACFTSSSTSTTSLRSSFRAAMESRGGVVKAGDLPI